MTAHVVSIFGADQVTENDQTDLPTDLELLAARIRAGDINAFRGIFVYQSLDTRVHNVALGAAIRKLEAVGLLAWAIEEVKRDDD